MARCALVRQKFLEYQRAVELGVVFEDKLSDVKISNRSSQEQIFGEICEILNQVAANFFEI